jgi:hypothetical protein
MLQQELENQRTECTEYERKLHDQGMAMDRQLQQALEEMDTIRKELVKQQSAKKDRAPAAGGDERLKEALADATTDLQVSFFVYPSFFVQPSLSICRSPTASFRAFARISLYQDSIKPLCGLY